MKRERVIHVFIRNVTGKFRQFHDAFFNWSGSLLAVQYPVRLAASPTAAR